MLVLWITWTQNVVDVSRDHEIHDACDGEVVVFCEFKQQAWIFRQSPRPAFQHPIIWVDPFVWQHTSWLTQNQWLTEFSRPESIRDRDPPCRCSIVNDNKVKNASFSAVGLSDRVNI